MRLPTHDLKSNLKETLAVSDCDISIVCSGSERVPSRQLDWLDGLCNTPQVLDSTPSRSEFRAEVMGYDTPIDVYAARSPTARLEDHFFCPA